MTRWLLIAALAAAAMTGPALALKHGSAPPVGGVHPTYFILGF